MTHPLIQLDPAPSAQLTWTENQLPHLLDVLITGTGFHVILQECCVYREEVNLSILYRHRHLEPLVSTIAIKKT